MIFDDFCCIFRCSNRLKAQPSIESLKREPGEKQISFSVLRACARVARILGISEDPAEIPEDPLPLFPSYMPP
jgi:hypothetical protein